MTDWPRLVATHSEIVWKTARRLLGTEADVADCFQEAFVAAFEFSRHQPVQNWPGLLVHLTTKRALDRLRKRQHSRATQLPETEASQPVCRQPPPSAVAEENELLHELRSGLAGLPPD